MLAESAQLLPKPTCHGVESSSTAIRKNLMNFTIDIPLIIGVPGAREINSGEAFTQLNGVALYVTDHEGRADVTAVACFGQNLFKMLTPEQKECINRWLTQEHDKLRKARHG